jgi:HPt (histidine-containing phosphotransfer) domain-containing protein
MDDYVSKPLRPNLLASALTRCLPPPPDHRASVGARPPEQDEITGELLDEPTLTELRDLAADDLRELVELYLNDAAAQALVVMAALEQGDSPAAAAAAHRLKGASATVGAALVSAIAAELETRAKAADLVGAAELLRSLERALMDTAVALRAALSSERPGARTA